MSDSPEILPAKIKALDVSIAGQPGAELLRQSQYELRYSADPGQLAAGLMLPTSELTYRSTDLFPAMDQNLPEGFLFMKLRELYPKQSLTPMHMLALMGDNGIGRLGYCLPGSASKPRPEAISKQALRTLTFTPGLFDDLVNAYLGVGAGISGMQPKIMVPDRVTVPIPNLIVKAASPSYPGLSANEFLCLSVARQAEIATPEFELSDDGELLILDRFDLREDGTRLGFEDIAALMGLSVRDTLADRKYQGSYKAVADVLKAINLSATDLAEFYAQVVLSVMLRNGDAHLKNFGVLYTSQDDVRLSPVFDVVTTAVYRYTRYTGGPELEDQTMALKLFPGKGQTKGYPSTAELLRFGREECGVDRPQEVIEKLATAMSTILARAPGDDRIPADTLGAMRQAWERGFAYERDCSQAGRVRVDVPGR